MAADLLASVFGRRWGDAMEHSRLLSESGCSFSDHEWSRILSEFLWDSGYGRRLPPLYGESASERHGR